MPKIYQEDIEPHRMHNDVSYTKQTHTHTHAPKHENTKIVGLRIRLRSGFSSSESVKLYLSFIWGHNRVWYIHDVHRYTAQSQSIKWILKMVHGSKLFINCYKRV